MRISLVRNRKGVMLLAAICLFVGVLLSPSNGVNVFADEFQYTDVKKDNTHYDNIMEVNDKGFMTGYSDGSFQPARSLSRGNVVKSLGKYIVKTSGQDLGDFDVSNVQPFSDVPPNFSDHELYRYSLIVKQAGVFTGDQNNLKPTNLITRQQMAKVLVNAFQLEAIQNVQSKVTDHHLALKEYRDYIDILSVNNVTVVANYKPKETTTRGQFASFLMRSHKAATNANQPDPTPNPDPNPIPDPDPDPDPVPDPEPQPDPQPVSVEEFQSIFAFVTTPIELPTTAKVFYDNDTNKDHPVVWNKRPEDLTVGDNQLTGTVTGTNFSVSLQVNLLPVLDVIIDVTIPDWVINMSKARDLMNKLPQAVKDADNPTDANLKIFEAMVALTKVKGPNQSAEVTNWEKEIDKQIELVKKWKKDLSSAIATAEHWVSTLAEGIKVSGNYSTAQSLINNTQLRVDRVVTLNKKYNTSTFMKTINEQQKVVNTMKELFNLSNKLIPKIEGPKDSIPKIVLEPQNYPAGIALKYTIDDDYDTSIRPDQRFEDILLRRPSFGSDSTKKYTFYYTKDNVEVYKAYNVTIPKRSIIFSDDPATLKYLNTKTVVK